MNEIRKTMLKFLILISLVTFTHTSQADCYNHYGRPCPFVPAPSGKVPPCARPGQTFCEHPDGYPGELIMFLAKLTRYNARMLVVDETKEDYSATTAPYPAAKYPTFYKDIDITTSQPPHNFHSQWRNGETIPSLTRNTTNFSGNSFDSYGDYQELSPQPGVQYSRYKYTSNIPHLQQFHDRFFGPSPDQFFPSTLQNLRTNFLWKRDVNKFTHLHDRVKRSELLRSHMRQIRESQFKKNFTGEVNLKRSKRQNGGLGSDELCQSRSTFVMPRAALNKNGVWMYVVNMENDNQKYTQLVKSEVCISQTCSSICGLPNGYTSKCEQKYVQKRLIALQGQGDQLYTDLFWIPSCCICTIQRN